LCGRNPQPRRQKVARAVKRAAGDFYFTSPRLRRRRAAGSLTEKLGTVFVPRHPDHRDYRWALGITLTYPFFGLAIFLPNFAVAVRRLHDIDRSGQVAKGRSWSRIACHSRSSRRGLPNGTSQDYPHERRLAMWPHLVRGAVRRRGDQPQLSAGLCSERARDASALPGHARLPGGLHL